MNNVTLLGRLTKDVVVTKTATQKSVANITIAVNRDYKDSNGERGVDFINVTVWGVNAENLAKFTVKGSQIAIVGQLRSRSYDKDGQTHYVTEVQADSFTLVETQAQTEARKAQAAAAAQA